MKLYSLTPALLCGIILLFSLPTIEAKAQFSLRADVRARSEYRHGYSTLTVPDTSAAFFISQRSRLILGYKMESLTLGMSVQDVRIWGDEEQQRDVPSLGLHEAWGDIAITDELGLKIGRQELVYDDQRLIGNSDWVQQGRSHDAAVLHFNDEGWKADLGGAYNQKAEYRFGTDYMASNYKVLSYLWLGKEFSDAKFSLLGVADGYQLSDTNTQTVYRYTYGGNGEYRFGGVTLKTTLYAQSGKDQNRKTISAYLATLAAGYTYENMGMTAGYELLSGTDMNEKEKNRSFHTLYPTNHKFYGLMDYFLVPPRDTKNGGLQHIYLALQYQPTQKLKLHLDGHHFSLASDIANPVSPGTPLSRALGTEVDLWATYNLTNDILLQGGYSQMFATESMERIKGGSRKEVSQWAWLMIIIKPVLFSN
jgi:hypothetical protein